MLVSRLFLTKGRSTTCGFLPPMSLKFLTTFCGSQIAATKFSSSRLEIIKPPPVALWIRLFSSQSSSSSSSSSPSPMSSSSSSSATQNTSADGAATPTIDLDEDLIITKSCVNVSYWTHKFYIYYII